MFENNMSNSSLKIILAVLLLLFLCENALTQNDENVTQLETKRVFCPKIMINVGIRTAYDDNILKYSPDYIHRFINNEDLGRFHIKTSDDMLLKPSISILVSDSIFRGKLSNLKLVANRNIFTHNAVNDFSFISMGIEQYLADSCKAGLSFEYIPNYYIGHLHDEDYTSFMGYVPATFMPLTYSKENFEVYYSRYFRETGVKLALNYTRCLYNVHFIEYDSKEPGVELELSRLFFKKKMRIKLLYNYSMSYAKGYDSDIETREKSDDSNASFYNNRIRISANLKLPKLLKHNNNMSIQLVSGIKRYTTSNFIEYDMLHVGRRDFNYQCELEYSYNVSKHLYFSFQYNLFRRNATSISTINRDYIGEEKSYHQNQFGIGVNYKFSLMKHKTKPDYPIKQRSSK